MRAVRWSVLGLGLVSVLLWLTSYSWMLGITPPTRWPGSDASPWWVAEVAAVVVGGVAVLAGLAARLLTGRDRAVRWGALLGGAAAVLSSAAVLAAT